MEKTLIEIKNKANEIIIKYDYKDEYDIKPYYKHDCFGVELMYKSLYDTFVLNVNLSLKILSVYDKLTNESHSLITYDEICIVKELIVWWYGEESEVI